MPKGVSRRNFLKLMGASSFMAVAACRRPLEQIVPAVIRPPEIEPGVPNYYSSVTPDGSGIVIRTRAGRPVKIAGNPEHPLSQGGLSASQVAALMDLYDPDRLRRAAVIDSRSSKLRYRPEEEIISKAQAQLKKGNYVLLTGALSSPSTRSLIQSFLRKYPGGRHMEFRPDPSLRQIAEGQKVCYGKALLPLYRIDRADYILSIDGDFLGSAPLAGLYASLYAKRRELRHNKKTLRKKMNKLLVFESSYSLTGSNADERYAMRPGDQSLIALTLAAHIVINMRKSPYAKNRRIRSLLKGYLAANVASELKHKEGLYQKSHFERIITRIAVELWEHRGRSLVFGASPLAANGVNAASQVAVNLLNSILANDGKTIDYRQKLLLSPGANEKEIQSIITELASAKIQSLIHDSQANLAYHLPYTLKVEEALKQAPAYQLSLSDRVDELSKFADAVLPTSHFLEAWGDSQIVEDLACIQQPVIRPLHKTLSFEDRLIQLAGGELEGHTTFYDFLRARWRSRSPARFRTFWVSLLQRGYLALRQPLLRTGSAPPRPFLGNSLDLLPRFSKEHWDQASTDKDKFYLGLYYNLQVGDGSLANNAYRQELPDPVTKIVWDNYVSMLPESARSMGLKQGSLIEVKSADGLLRLPLHLQPGLHPQAVSIALGYGRSAAGKVADGLGQNAMQLVGLGSDSFAFSGNVIQIKDTKEMYELASTQAIYRHNSSQEEKAPFSPKHLHELPYRASSQHGRPIVRETNYEAFQKGSFELKPDAIKYPAKQEITKEWDYEGTRWHMFIDLHACTGCGACVSSCNTENNIPMAGKEEVKVGREMHWLRIDRYFSGAEDNPQLSHQPMLCQHCENAPCESVCPVAATTHNQEGLNVMTYNRCIGTRYCANNCPYKVRRFNWFENWNYAEGLETKLREPQHLALNPDVTVRSRGVMEKCTFCVQRIASARQEHKAKNKTGVIEDGVVKTACQEVCPSQAISFGNILDPQSEVSSLRRKEKRSYKVLEFLGVKPQVTYLAKVRNTPKDSNKQG